MSGQAEEVQSRRGPAKAGVCLGAPATCGLSRRFPRAKQCRQRAQVQSQATEADSTSKHGHSDLSGPPHASRAWPLSIKQENLFPFP